MRAIVIFSLICFGSLAFAQENDLISFELDNVPIEELISRIEDTTPYFFYFRASDIDSVYITVVADQKSISWILTNAFGSSGINYAILNTSIILSKDVEIRTQIPLGFFDKESNAPVNLDIAAFNFSEEKIEKTQDSKNIEDQIIEIGKRTTIVEGRKINLTGNVHDISTGEAIVGAIVYIEEPRIGVITDAFGYYNIQISQGRHTLKIRSVGMKETKREILLFDEGSLEIEMVQDVIGLKEVIVEAERSVNITGVQMGIEKMTMADVRQVPTVLGEMDIAKIALTLPGVQSVGEGASGFNVRGGATDQNLVLMNDAILYNPSHFFGFFSVFNPDIIKSATLLKGGIPAQYGGRISSIFDVKTRDGNKKTFSGRGGISPVTARLTLEGPIGKNTSFIVGGRSTYSDWLLNQVSDVNIKNSSASFYDINAKITHDFGDKDAIYLSGYYSKDNFRLFSDSVYTYQNFNTTIQWKHNFSNKLIAALSGNYSRYDYNIGQQKDSLNAFGLKYNLSSVNAKLDFTYFPTSDHVIDFGLSTILYDLEPGMFTSESEFSQVEPISLEPERGLESAIYVGDNFTVSEQLLVYVGLRYSVYRFLGPKTVYNYPEGVPKSPTNALNATTYGSNEVIQTYHGPELRASLRYSLDFSSSIKAGYNRMRQYIHMLTNTAAISPTDTWKLSDTHILPQVGDQVSLGYYRNLKNNSIEASAEVFYKKVKDIIEYKGGAQLLLNKQIETDLINGQNRSYGLELLLRKKMGKLNGWISYTYSRSLNRVQGESSDETINNGEYFPANYDKPHSLNIIANYKFSRRLSLSTNWVYSTGRPITYPVARYQLGNSERIFYSKRNEFRIPDYFRIDVSLQIEGNHKVDKPGHSSWALSVYNLLGRNNVYSIYFVSEGGKVQGYKLSVFGSAIPTVTYNFKF